MDINSIILLIAIGANALLCGLVWRAGRRSMSAQLFLAMVGLVMLWTIANFEIDASATAADALFWTRSLYVSALGYIYVFYIFARTFGCMPLPRVDTYSVTLSLLTLISILLTLSRSGLIFSDAAVSSAGLSELTFGPLYLPVNLLGLIIASSAIIALAQTARKAGRTILRDQAVLVIVGWVIFLLLVIIFAAILPFFIPAFVNSSKIAPLFSIVMVGCSTYAMVKHRFLDVTPYIRRGLVYSLLLSTILGFYLCLLFILAYLVRTDSDLLEFFAGAITVIIGILGAPRIEFHFRRMTDRIFFKDTYKYSDALEELCRILNTTARIPQLLTPSLKVLTRILKSERIEFIYAKTGTRYTVNGENRAPSEQLFPGEDGLRIPVCSEERIIGELLLWPKRSGDPYTKEDESLLRTFASQATVALEKAEFYEQLKEYSNQLEEKVRDRTRHLEDLRASQREFMDNISHALQTPLTVLTSTMEIVTKALPPQQSRYACLAAQSIGELSRLTSNLLALARIEALPSSGESASLDLSEVIRRLAEYVDVICASKGITFETDIELGISCMGNRVQIEEAVTNLLSNAVRYTTGCPIRIIRLALEGNEAHALISIRDTGVGISPERLPYIFERFYRAQDSQGTGIGLAISKRIVERHGGSIEVKSDPGTGTIMTIRLPHQTETVR